MKSNPVIIAIFGALPLTVQQVFNSPDLTYDERISRYRDYPGSTIECMKPMLSDFAEITGKAS